MSIVQLKSDNPKMSWVISKNPESGMLVKGLRLGTAFGWFKDSAYNVFFKDAEDEVSYKAHQDEQFEYLNSSRFNSALFILNTIDEFFRSAFKEKHELDVSDSHKNEFFINMINVKNERYITAFQKYFEDYEVEYENIAGDNYRVVIRTEKSIHELLNFVAVFGIFNAIVNDDDIYVTSDVIKKYLTCMNNIDAPYFMRYLFKIRFLESEGQFNKFKGELCNTDRAEISMTYGDNWFARQREIENRLSFSNSIIDVGCGEGKYITRFARKIKDNKINYYAIDVHEETLEEAKRRVRNKRIDNVNFYSSVKELVESGDLDWDKNGKFDVILTEVVEHMPMEEASKLVSDILSIKGVERVIVTTPDVRFNENYFISEEGNKMRHDDHDWEPTKSEFLDFINDSINREEVLLEWFEIGDSVNGVTPTQGVVIEVKKD
jgi:2-polyprenyl-3-methyl-5-hydroxy-6-metoxy-1,4-benzoquinol methylase